MLNRTAATVTVAGDSLDFTNILRKKPKTLSPFIFFLSRRKKTAASMLS
jgi:hypothetical protein